jgi:hypothetical protein
MAVRYIDDEIKEMISEPKPLMIDLHMLPRLTQKRGHREKHLDLDGVRGNRYRLILRQTDANPLDFSIILTLIPPESNQLFTLRRYNGKSHEHTNQIERETFYDFHIHTATERYQEIGADEETYAEPTDRYGDYHTALRCMLEDCGFKIPDDGQARLF